jgi:hypothetical protein
MLKTQQIQGLYIIFSKLRMVYLQTKMADIWLVAG